MKSLRSIWVVGEKDIFNELAQMITITAEANVLVKAMFHMNYDEKALTQALHEVRALEKKSDELAFKLGESIIGGAVSPNILGILLECVHVADDMVDTYYYLGRELYRMSKAKSADFKIHQETTWVSVYDALLGLAEQSISKLEKALSTGNVSEILEMRRQIEVLEEQGDDIKDAAFDKLYSVGPNLHYLQFYHYSEMLHKSDNILDSCEDFSDLIVSAVTSILK